MEKTDKELFTDFKNGDETAFNMLFMRYKNRVFNFCIRVLDNRADAEDATSEAFMILFEKKYTDDPNAQFSTWLFTVARNRSLTKIRGRKGTGSMWFSKDGGPDEMQLDIKDPKDPEDLELIKKEAKAHVRLGIRKLPPGQKEALVLREYNKMSYAEIGTVLGCSLENVKILIFRAREQLRVELSPLIKGENNG